MRYLLNKRLKKRSKIYKARGPWGVICILFLGIITGLGLTGDRAHAEIIKSDNNEVLTGTVNNETEKTSFSGEDKASTDFQSPITNEMATEKLGTEVNQTANNTQDVNTAGSSTYERGEQASPQESQPSPTPSMNAPKETKVVKDDEVKFPQSVAVERQENGHWYLYNPQTNTKYTGFQTLKDGRVVYYNDQGQMQYGEQNIDHHWYLFDQWTGALKNGFQYIPKYQKTVYYNQDGQMQYGWQQVNGYWYYLENRSGALTRGQKKIAGHWYNFDHNNGQMSTGFTYLPDDKKTVYYAANGWMVYGEKQIAGYWYLFDQGSGALRTGFQKLPGGRTVYYNNQGQMQYGEQKIGSGWTWYLFDQSSGAMKNGFQTLADGRKVYYAPNGQMQYGEQQIGGYWYLFDSANGAMKTGFQYIPKYKKTVYYNQNGQMLYGWQQLNGSTYYLEYGSGAVTKGQKNIGNYWYNFDLATGQMTTGFTYLPDDQKLVYYDQNGQMQYGEQKIADHWYLFDEGSGEMQIGFQYLPYDNKVVYYQQNGQMQYGWQEIDGNTYYFDLGSGAMATGRQTIADAVYYFEPTAGTLMKKAFVYERTNSTLSYVNEDGLFVMNGRFTIDDQDYSFDGYGVLEHSPGEAKLGGYWYLFGNGNQVLVGFQTLSDGRIVYYSPTTAQMQYYQQEIAGHWYLFDRGSGAMKTGFQRLDDGRTVYYASNGQMLYYQQKIAGHWYLFDKWTGAMKVGFQKLDDGRTVYYASNGQMQYGQQKINGYWYLFNKWTGAMQTGLQYIADQHKTVFYGNDGRMKYGTFRVGRVTYYADNDAGAIHGVYHDADVIAQLPELPTGCEITAVAIMLRYAGVNVSKTQLANEMPRSNDPNKGFVGNPFNAYGYGNWVAPGGVAPVISKHLGHSQIMTGASMQAIQDKLLHGHLVVVWLANYNGFGTHSVTLTGYNNGTLYYNNPWTARKESISVNAFYTHWNKDARRAISY